jgi:NTP pyrophosphatase (non-canonical NTP hydrolase)
MTPGNAVILISDYDRLAGETDKFPPEDLVSIQLGLFGEVGGVMAAAKKHRREGKAFIGYQRAVEEEFGDALWYFAALCRRTGMNLGTVLLNAASSSGYSKSVAAAHVPFAAVCEVSEPTDIEPLDQILMRLGYAASTLLAVESGTGDLAERMRVFADCYLKALRAAEISLAAVVERNLTKARGRFLEPNWSELPTFDAGFDEEERLPQEFEIAIVQRKSGFCVLEMNGVILGDPLTDNITDRDGYRFHDVFHFAHAAILHWSPTFRALIKHKRKSDPHIDESQDGGRAIVVEEGLSALIFAHAKRLDLFDGQNSVSFDLLKTIRQFVDGYEVEACPLKLWEDAILQGYEVFRRVLTENGGFVSGSRSRRKIAFRSMRGS